MVVKDRIFVYRNFIQTFGKYFDSTNNVACQIGFLKKIKREIQCPSAVQVLL